MKEISVVIPVYGCPEALEPLYDRLKATLEQLVKSFEIIMVNDACPKGSWDEIRKICMKDDRVTGINLSRNFGQIHATNAGIEKSEGEYLVLMDCDLQDRPEGIADLYKEINKGYDVVFVKRKERKDSFLVKALSKLFYKIYNYFVDGYYDGEIGNFCIVRRKIVDEYKKIDDYNKSFTTTLAWMGYNSTVIEIESDKRYEGNSGYTLRKKINLAIDMITSQSNKPLKSLMACGVILVGISIIYILYKSISNFFGNETPDGWTSLFAAILFIGGIQIVSIGGVGIYIGNIFNQTKGRPEYLIKEVLNDQRKTDK